MYRDQWWSSVLNYIRKFGKMSNTAKTNREKRNAETQTNDIDTMLEIVHLQEQVKLLTIENDHLRKYTVGEISRLQEQVKLLTIENDHLRKYTVGEPSTATKTTPTMIELRSSNEVETPRSVRSRQRSQNVQNIRKKNSSIMRGCNCKGRCASKICGCVNGNILCGEMCKCTSSVCENQEKYETEQNKENLENIEVVQVEGNQIKNKNLINAAPQKSLFSPDIPVSFSTPNLEQCILPSVRFGNPITLFQSNSDDRTLEQIKETKEEKTTKKHKTEKKNTKNTVTQKRGRQKNNLEVDSAPTRKLRSVSNEEKSRQNETEKETLRSCSSNDISDLTDDGIVTIRCGNENKNLSCEKEIQENDNANPQLNDRGANLKKNVENEMPQQLAIKDPKLSDREHAGHQEKHNESQPLEDNFDPMKPKYELPRTPTNKKQTIEFHCVIRYPMFRSSFMQEEKELPVPEELNQAEVDWEEYQAQLVACNKCKRKFHPSRIKKHEACCKKV